MSELDLFRQLEDLDSMTFSSGDYDIDNNNEIGDRMVVIVQEPGDLILIPPNYWHQVYLHIKYI